MRGHYTCFRCGGAEEDLDAEVYYAPGKLCTDNGAMIAHAGTLRLLAGERTDLKIQPRPRWPMFELPAIESA